MKYQKGDKVKIKLVPGYSHKFDDGQIVEITILFPEYYRADSKDDYWFIYDEDIECKI